MYDLMANNKVTLAGKVATTPEFYHEAYDEKFYTFILEIPRLSETSDKVPVMVSERILDEVSLGSYVLIDGQLRTYNKFEGDRRKLLLFAFARDIETISEAMFHDIKHPNVLTLRGFICRTPQYRTTPFGREICDLLLAVNRAYKKSDYIPTIAWGRNAKFCDKLAVGQEIEITGRVQSRDYVKKTEGGEETRTAFEVSVSKIKVVTDEAEIQE